ncbi:MAG: PAS domain S-box protein, partial [Gemmatimonadaceae bacterium]
MTHSPTLETGPFPTSRVLTRRLPLTIAVVVALVAAGISWTAYVRVRQAALETTDARLASVTREIADALQSQLRRAIHSLEGLANRPGVVAYLQHPASADSTAAEHLLDSLRGHGGSLTALSLWTRGGTLLLASGSSSNARATLPALEHTPADAVLPISELATVGDSIIYGVAVPIRLGADDTLGYMLVTARLNDPAEGPAIAKLIGQDAHLLLTSTNARVWTDMVKVVSSPMAAGQPRSSTRYRGRDGRDHMAQSAAIGGAPWRVWVDVPRDAALATARQFLVDIVGIALAFVLLGALIAWLIVRRLTRPVKELNAAAHELACGDYARRVSVRADDELGHLAQSFNTMAERVQVAAAELTSRAHALEERNQELHESELRYRQLVDQSPDAIVVHRDGQIVFASSVAAGLVGAAEPGELVGRPLLDLVHVDDRPEVQRRIARVLASGEASALSQARLIRLDGTEVNVEVTGVPVLFDGQPAIQTLARDVSERMQLEEQFRQSQKME